MNKTDEDLCLLKKSHPILDPNVFPNLLLCAGLSRTGAEQSLGAPGRWIPGALTHGLEGQPGPTAVYCTQAYWVSKTWLGALLSLMMQHWPPPNHIHYEQVNPIAFQSGISTVSWM